MSPTPAPTATAHRKRPASKSVAVKALYLKPAPSATISTTPITTTDAVATKPTEATDSMVVEPTDSLVIEEPTDAKLVEPTDAEMTSKDMNAKVRHGMKQVVPFIPKGATTQATTQATTESNVDPPDLRRSNRPYNVFDYSLFGEDHADSEDEELDAEDPFNPNELVFDDASGEDLLDPDEAILPTMEEAVEQLKASSEPARKVKGGRYCNGSPSWCMDKSLLLLQVTNCVNELITVYGLQPTTLKKPRADYVMQGMQAWKMHDPKIAGTKLTDYQATYRLWVNPLLEDQFEGYMSAFVELLLAKRLKIECRSSGIDGSVRRATANRSDMDEWIGILLDAPPFDIDAEQWASAICEIQGPNSVLLEAEEGEEDDEDSDDDEQVEQVEQAEGGN